VYRASRWIDANTVVETAGKLTVNMSVWRDNEAGGSIGAINSFHCCSSDAGLRELADLRLNG